MLTLLLSLLVAPQDASTHDYWGTITIVEDDERRVPASGWIDFCITSGLDQRVVVDEGRWQLDTGAQDVMYVGNVELEGRMARSVPEPERWRQRGEHALWRHIPTAHFSTSRMPKLEFT